MMILKLPLAALLIAPATSGTPVIDISAVPSKFTPAQITMHRGVATELRFSHIEGVHAIESSALGIPKTVLAPGKDVSVTLVAKKAGTYVLHCEIVCGEDHDKMTLTINVEE